jgi:hypothetical protein
MYPRFKTLPTSSADDVEDTGRFNRPAATFNEDISGWDVSSATTLTSMFESVTSFDQPFRNIHVHVHETRLSTNEAN